MIFLGVDPGKSGAVAAILESGVLVLHDTPVVKAQRGKTLHNVAGMVGIIQKYANVPVMACLELNHALPGQGVSSMWSMGQGSGLWEGILASLKVPYELASPQRWRKLLLAGLPQGDTKAVSIMAAQRMFPQAASAGDFVGPKGGARDGRADAALLAEYMRRTYVGVSTPAERQLALVV